MHFIHDRHHSQHEQSVSAAKQALQDQLAKLGAQNGYVQGSTQYGNSYGTSGSEKYVDRCATCYGVSENLASHTSRYILRIKYLIFILMALWTISLHNCLISWTQCW